MRSTHIVGHLAALGVLSLTVSTAAARPSAPLTEGPWAFPQSARSTVQAVGLDPDDAPACARALLSATAALGDAPVPTALPVFAPPPEAPPRIEPNADRSLVVPTTRREATRRAAAALSELAAERAALARQTNPDALRRRLAASGHPPERVRILLPRLTSGAALQGRLIADILARLADRPDGWGPMLPGLRADMRAIKGAVARLEGRTDVRRDAQRALVAEVGLDALRAARRAQAAHVTEVIEHAAQWSAVDDAVRQPAWRVRALVEVLRVAPLPTDLRPILRAVGAAPPRWQPVFAPLLARIAADAPVEALADLGGAAWRMAADHVGRLDPQRRAAIAATLLAAEHAPEPTGPDRALWTTLAVAAPHTEVGGAHLLSVLKDGTPAEQLHVARAVRSIRDDAIAADIGAAWPADPLGRPWGDHTLEAVVAADESGRWWVLWFDARGAEQARWALPPGAARPQVGVYGALVADAEGHSVLHGFGHPTARPIDLGPPAPSGGPPWTSPWPRSSLTPHLAPAGGCGTGRPEDAAEVDIVRALIAEVSTDAADDAGPRLERQDDHGLALVRDGRLQWRTPPLPDARSVRPMGPNFVALAAGAVVVVDGETGAIRRIPIGADGAEPMCVETFTCGI